MRNYLPPQNRSFEGLLNLLKYQKIFLYGVFIFFLCFPTLLSAQQKHFYIANDNHTDYFWSGTAEQYKGVAVREIDYYLGLSDDTDDLPAPFQSRFNLDGAWYAYEYRRNKSEEDFQRLLGRIASGHFSLPLNYLVSTYGGQPTEAVIRGMYWPARLARLNGLDVHLASTIENQTLPLGLSSLWAGSGVKYSWKGVCGCSSTVPSPKLRDRNHEIYWYRGLDDSQVLMKWYSLTLAGNSNLGGYAEARFPSAAIDVGAEKCNTPNYPYNIIGAFGYGWDDLEATTDIFVQMAQQLSNASQQVYVSNESDFFDHFLQDYEEGLPSETVTYGNDWDVDCASLASITSKLRYSVEKLRTAEALASLAAMLDPDIYPATDTLREQAWITLGSYWEHDFGLGGIGAVTERGNWQIELQEKLSTYVDTLFKSSLEVVSKNIRNPSGNLRFFVFNGLGWARQGYADVPYDGDSNIRVVEVADGREVPHQLITLDGKAYLRILANEIPAIGYKVYEIQPGPAAGSGNAAVFEGGVFENAYYRLALTSEGVITSLIDKINGAREYVKATDGRYLNDFGQGLGESGTLALLHNGPVSAKVACTSANPLQHTTYITLYRDIRRIDITNRITDEFGDAIRTYSFPFDVETPTVWHEELGAVIKAKYLSNGGHYAPADNPVRYDWQTLNHFVDVGTENEGITLSNEGASFMKLGNSSGDFLDENASNIRVLIGGRMAASGSGFENQFGQTEFNNGFSLRTRLGPFNAGVSMRFALEHQSPLVGKMMGSGGELLDEGTFSLLGISNPDVLLWALKPSEEGIEAGGLIARFWNMDTQSQPLVVDFASDVLSAEKTTHLETGLEPAVVVENNLTATLGQQKMETFRVFLDNVLSGCSSRSSISATICEGEALEGYTESGTYTDTFTGTNGCDSMRTLVLTVLPRVSSTISATICEGEALEGYTESGTYTDTFTGTNGCDSLRTLALTVLPGVSSTISATICEGEALEGYTESGTYTDTFTGSNGCDSLRTLVLTVLPGVSSTISATICEGEALEGYTESGTYTDTFTGTNGCDSLRTLVLTVLPRVSSTISATICEGEALEGYTESGTYTDTFTGSNGCDSLRTLVLTVLPGVSSTISATICEGEALEGYTESGTYTDTFTGSNGCDSMRTLALTVLPGVSSTISATICEGEALEGYTESGTYTDTFTGTNGCDSLRMLVLSVVMSDRVTIEKNTCDSTQVGQQVDTLLNQNGCDSIITTNTIFIPLAFEVQVTDVSCFGERDGVIAIESQANYDINWGNGQVGPKLVGLEAGSYSFTLIDPQTGCFSMSTVIVRAPQELTASLETQPASSNGTADGTASVSPSGGHEPYTVEWSTGADGFQIEGLAAGAYSATVTDANECKDTISFEITVLSGLKAITSLRTFELYPNPASEQINLILQFEQSVQGKIAIIDLLGRELYTEEFEGSIHKSIIPVDKFPAGIYLVRVAVGGQEVLKSTVIE